MNDLTIEELKKIRDDALDAVAAADAAYDDALNKKKGPKIVIERWFNVIQSPDYDLYIEQYSTKNAAYAAAAAAAK